VLGWRRGALAAAFLLVAVPTAFAKPDDAAELKESTKEWLNWRFKKGSFDPEKAAAHEKLVASVRAAHEGTSICAPKRMKDPFFTMVLTMKMEKLELADPSEPAADVVLRLGRETFPCNWVFDPSVYEGDGKTIETAVTRKGGGGIGSTYNWLHHHYPGFKMQRQALSSTGDGRRYDFMTFITAEGELLTRIFRLPDEPGPPPRPPAPK
jgi:hypothetical protein